MRGTRREPDAHWSVAGSGGRAVEPGRGQRGRARLPELGQDQHLLVGQGAQIVLQAQKVPHQTTPRGSGTPPSLYANKTR